MTFLYVLAGVTALGLGVRFVASACDTEHGVDLVAGVYLLMVAYLLFAGAVAV